MPVNQRDGKDRLESIEIVNLYVVEQSPVNQRRHKMTLTYTTREQLRADTGHDWLVECENVLEAHDFGIDHLEGDHRRLAERVNNEVFGPNEYLWDCGGCRVWTVTDEGRLRLTYDGGALYDHFSVDGDGAYMTPDYTYGLRDAVRAIGQDFGLEMECYAGWCDVFY